MRHIYVAQDIHVSFTYFLSVCVSRVICGACVLWRFPNDNDYMWHIGYIAYLSARAIVEWLGDDSFGRCVQCTIGHINESINIYQRGKKSIKDHETSKQTIYRLSRKTKIQSSRKKFADLLWRLRTCSALLLDSLKSVYGCGLIFVQLLMWLIVLCQCVYEKRLYESPSDSAIRFIKREKSFRLLNITIFIVLTKRKNEKDRGKQKNKKKKNQRARQKGK